jgi:hypothetical protein
MLWFTRRSRQTKAEQGPPALSPQERDEPRLRTVLRYELAYGRQTATSVALLFGMVALIAGLIAISATAGEAFDAPEALSFRLPFSFETGLASLGILATLVIALQVSVRGMSGSDDRERALGRQLVLETVSLVTGMSAFLIFFAVVGSYSPSESFARLGQLIALLGGATLIAVIAVDAATASSGSFGKKLGTLRDLNAYARLRGVLSARRTSTTHTTTWLKTISGAMVVLVVGSIAAALPLALQWRADLIMVLLLTAALVALAGTLMSVVSAFANLMSAHGQYGLSVYMWMIGAMVTAGTASALFTVSADAPTPSTTAARAVLSAGSIMILLLQTALLTGRLPVRGGSVPSLGHRVVTASIWKSVEKLREKRAKPLNVSASRPSIGSTLLLVAAFVVPPVVAITSHVQLAVESRPATRARLKRGRLISAVVTVLLTLAMTALVFYERSN